MHPKDSWKLRLSDLERTLGRAGVHPDDRADLGLRAVSPLPGLARLLGAGPMTPAATVLVASLALVTSPVVGPAVPPEVTMSAQTTGARVGRPGPVQAPAAPAPTVRQTPPARSARRPHADSQRPRGLVVSPPPGPRRFDFEDDEVTGVADGPDDALVHGRRPPARRSSLIEIPSSFVAALARSLEDL